MIHVDPVADPHQIAVSEHFLDVRRPGTKCAELSTADDPVLTLQLELDRVGSAQRDEWQIADPTYLMSHPNIVAASAVRRIRPLRGLWITHSAVLMTWQTRHEYR